MDLRCFTCYLGGFYINSWRRKGKIYVILQKSGAKMAANCSIYINSSRREGEIYVILRGLSRRDGRMNGDFT